MHSDAPTAATDWGQVRQLYDQLMAVAPSPVVALNRAVAVAETDGPAQALALVDALDLDGYHVLHAVRADLLRRLGRDAEAADAYAKAAALTENPAERTYLEHRSRSLSPHHESPDGGPECTPRRKGCNIHLHRRDRPQGQPTPARHP